MFFFMIFVAIDWQGLDAQAFQLAVKDRFYGETVGVIVAMIALALLQRWQQRDGR